MMANTAVRPFNDNPFGIGERRPHIFMSISADSQWAVLQFGIPSKRRGSTMAIGLGDSPREAFESFERDKRETLK